jgi:hypothetical protein
MKRRSNVNQQGSFIEIHFLGYPWGGGGTRAKILIEKKSRWKNFKHI